MMQAYIHFIDQHLEMKPSNYFGSIMSSLTENRSIKECLPDFAVVLERQEWYSASLHKRPKRKLCIKTMYFSKHDQYRCISDRDLVVRAKEATFSTREKFLSKAG